MQWNLSNQEHLGPLDIGGQSTKWTYIYALNKRYSFMCMEGSWISRVLPVNLSRCKLIDGTMLELDLLQQRGLGTDQLGSMLLAMAENHSRSEKAKNHAEGTKFSLMWLKQWQITTKNVGIPLMWYCEHHSGEACMTPVILCRVDHNSTFHNII